MSQRPGILATTRSPSPKPPWTDPSVPDPRSQVPAITFEVRGHWPFWASRDDAIGALNAVYSQALGDINERFAR